MIHTYVDDPMNPSRRLTRVVSVGDVQVGGENPIRIQSMTNSDTLDTAATVDQIERLAAAGCEIVRITVPSIRDAENLPSIKAALARRSVRVPLVADIHFTPNAALIAAEHVEKVRINPGNFADKKKFEVREYSDSEYASELERVAKRFRPLVLRCKENGVAMRIGTNHGSLSDRIMNRYGDSPLGMVESALEFLDVCEAENFDEVIFSMKASNTHVAIQAYRMLSARLAERAPGEPSYPFHLGVTEAGDGEDGRIKSAMGIGALLEDGIGDTIRVSLTEDPVRELPVAEAIVQQTSSARVAGDGGSRKVAMSSWPTSVDPFGYQRRRTQLIELSSLRFGEEEPVRVEVEIEGCAQLDEAAGLARASVASLARVSEVACESVLIRLQSQEHLLAFDDLVDGFTAAGLDVPISMRMSVGRVLEAGSPPNRAARWVIDVSPLDEFRSLEHIARTAANAGVPLEWCLQGERSGLVGLLHDVLRASGPVPPCALSLELEPATAAIRLLVAELEKTEHPTLPVVLRHPAGTLSARDHGAVAASVDLGASLCDGVGDMVSLHGADDPAAALDLAYRVLQAARLRTTRTEYISCPSCGRTLFDLEEVTARIKQSTDHLKGVKIAIMGCIVNGPGEMADADFGYVGSGPGVVTLYVGKDVVARNIPEEEAPRRLEELIEEHGLGHSD